MGGQKTPAAAAGRGRCSACTLRQAIHLLRTRPDSRRRALKQMKKVAEAS